MKFRKAVSLTVFSMILFYCSSATAQQNPYPKLTSLMQEFHEVSSKLQFDMTQSLYLIEKIINFDPNVEEIKNVARSIDEKTKEFERVSKEITDFINKNEKALATSQKEIEKLKGDSSTKVIAKITDFANSLNGFSQTLNETEFTVYANEGWANAGVVVNTNDLIWVDSKGSWTVSPSYEMVGWQGYTCNSSNIYNLNKSATLGALIYRVRGSSNADGYSLNENKRGKIDSKGRLEFVINDEDRKNNSGQLDLKVVVINGDAFENLIKAFQSLKEENDK